MFTTSVSERPNYLHVIIVITNTTSVIGMPEYLLVIINTTSVIGMPDYLYVINYGIGGCGWHAGEETMLYNCACRE